MDRMSHKIAMKVAVQHAAKQAVELAISIGSLVEKIDYSPARFDTDACWARGNIASIRRELDDLEHLLAGREPPVEVCPQHRSEAA